MTPAQLAALEVAKDGLRTAGFDDATLARMERAVEGRIETAVVSYMTELEAGSVRWTDDAEELEREQALYDHALNELRECAILIDCATFSPAETPAAASARQPRSETARPAVIGPKGCRRCHGDGYDRCHCEFPGAGAG